MKKSTKIWVAIAVCMIVVGGIIAFLAVNFGGSTVVQFDGKKFVVPKNDEIILRDVPLDDFTDIDLESSFFDIKFVESDHDALDITYNSNQKPEYRVENGTFIFRDMGSDSFFPPFQVGFPYSDRAERALTIYYKAGTTFDYVKIESDYGDLNFGKFSAKKLELGTSYSEVTIDEANFTTAEIDADYSGYKLNKLTVQDLSFSSTYSNLTLKNSEFDTVELEMDFGEANATNCTVKKTTDFEGSYSGLNWRGDLLGRTTINTEFSDVNLDLNSSDYTYSTSIDFGDFIVNGEEQRHSNYKVTLGVNNIKFDITYGDIKLNFPQ